MLFQLCLSIKTVCSSLFTYFTHIYDPISHRSYTWGYKFKDIVDTLITFCEDKNLDPKRTYIWICALCNNQHRITNDVVPFEEFQRIFRKRVRGIGNILAMMTPWNDPGYLKRVWCVFEMYSANADACCNIQIIMPPRDKSSLISAVHRATDSSGRNGLDDLFVALANTKVENANSSWASDKENILRIVENGPGCNTLNIEINDLLRAWVRDTVFNAAKESEESLDDNGTYEERKEIATFLTFCASFFSKVAAFKEALELHAKALVIYESLLGKGRDEDARELMARCYNNMGTEQESLGKYDDALEQHNKCRETFENIYGTEHENTSVSYFNIGAVYRKMGKNEKALEMYNKSLEIDKKIKGENHIDVALSYSYIGRVFQHNEEYDKALDMFQKSLEIRESTYGKNHPDAAIGYGDMGLLYHMQQKYDEAIKMHEKSLAISESVLGKTHADTASVYQNLGGAYYEKGQYEKALSLHKQALHAYLTTYGPNHPKTATSQEWIAIVKEAIGEK